MTDSTLSSVMCTVHNTKAMKVSALIYHLDLEGKGFASTFETIFVVKGTEDELRNFRAQVNALR